MRNLLSASETFARRASRLAGAEYCQIAVSIFAFVAETIEISDSVPSAFNAIAM